MERLGAAVNGQTDADPPAAPVSALLARVDCVADQTLCQSYDVKGIPRLHLLLQPPLSTTLAVPVYLISAASYFLSSSGSDKREHSDLVFALQDFPPF